MPIAPYEAAVRRLIGFIFLALSWACTGALPAPPQVAQPAKAFVEVPYPAPPARPEQIPDKPQADAVWIDGEWAWRRRRWGWIYGRWLLPPAEGARFAAAAQKRDRRGTLRWAPGTWYSAEGKLLVHPIPLAFARADEGRVIDAEGNKILVAPNRNAHRERRWLARRQRGTKQCGLVGGDC
jgi:hypothetical protein